ncbi:MAG TPA: hypothetical protein VF510_13165 [Ktedonobacterales bacterium]
MQMRSVMRRTVGVAWAAIVPATLCLVLASCGGASAASNGAAAPTPTCPPAASATASLKVVSGKITSTGAGSITVSPSSGGSVTVQITSTTRITKLASSSLSTVQVGEVAQVTPDATGTIAQRIIVQGAGGFGRGSTSGRQPSATRVPGSGFNPACSRRAGSGTGGFGATNGQGGRVSEVSSSQIVLTDAQGQTLTYSVTATTVILAPTTGSATDLKTGAAVTVTGQAASSSITARSIVVTSAAQ